MQETIKRHHRKRTLVDEVCCCFCHKQRSLRRPSDYIFNLTGSKQIHYSHVSLKRHQNFMRVALFNCRTTTILTFEVFDHQLLSLARFSGVVGQWGALMEVISISGEIRFPLRLSHCGILVFDTFHAQQCLLFLVRVKIQLTLKWIGRTDARSVLNVVTQSTFFPRSAVFRHVCVSLVHV